MNDLNKTTPFNLFLVTPQGVHLYVSLLPQDGEQHISTKNIVMFLRS